MVEVIEIAECELTFRDQLSIVRRKVRDGVIKMEGPHVEIGLERKRSEHFL